MTDYIRNTCARCGVSIKHEDDLCHICNAETTNRIAMVSCIACGAANLANINACESCGAPLECTAASVSSKELRQIDMQGRQAELQVLEDCFDFCLDNQIAGGAIVTGENGMGVSSLLNAFCERLSGRLSTDRIFHIRCRKDEDLFGPIREILRQRFKNNTETDAITARLRFTDLVGKVLGLDSAALVTETTHLLGYLSNLPFPSSPVLRTLGNNQNLLLKRMKEAIIRFLVADTKKHGPVALVIDSFHRKTKECQTFHIDLFNSIGSSPVNIVIGGIPFVKKISDNESIIRVELEPIDDEIMKSLFREYMPLLPYPPYELVDMAISKSAGNPGSLKQLCALLTESGVVDTSTDPWTVNITKLNMADMPVNLLDALKARLKKLDSRDRAVLKFASILGEMFWDEGIIALSRQQINLKNNIGAAQVWADDSDGLAVSSSLNRLVNRQFVVLLPDNDVPGSMKYAFARSGIREAIMGSIDDDEKKHLHSLAAQWFAHSISKKNPRFAELEALQWEAAKENHHAAVSFLRAARYAREKYLNQKAIKLFNKTLNLADDRDLIIMIDTVHDLGSVQELVGNYAMAEQCFTQMLKYSWILVHRSKAGAALNKIGRLYRARGDYTAARAFIDRGMSLFKAANDEKGVASCLGDLGELARRQGSYDRAFKMVSQALKIQRQIGNKPSMAFCLQSLGHIEASRASYTQAERYLEEALEIRRHNSDKGGMAHTLSTLAIVLFNRGDLEKAITRWKDALKLAVEVGDRRMTAIGHNNLGEALRDQGKLDESMKHFKLCEKIVTTLDDRLIQAEVARNIGILAYKMTNLETAKIQLKRSLALSKEIRSKELEGLAIRGLGEVVSATMWDTSNIEGNDDAINYYEAALAIFESIGNDNEIARTQHVYGTRLLERGDLNGGKTRLEEAKLIYQRIQSKAGEKIGRLIKEITMQPPISKFDQLPKPTKNK